MQRWRIQPGSPDTTIRSVLQFTFFGFLAVRTIDQSKDVALEERQRLAETTAQSVDALLEHTTGQLEVAAALPVPDGGNSALRIRAESHL